LPKLAQQFTSIFKKQTVLTDFSKKSSARKAPVQLRDLLYPVGYADLQRLRLFAMRLSLTTRSLTARLTLTALLYGLAAATGVRAVNDIKLAACTIAKMASTNTIRFLNAARGANRYAWSAEAGKHASFTPLLPSQFIPILNDSSWTKFVILREPVERFASAFQHKCVRNPFFSELKHCPAKVQQNNVHAVLTALEQQFVEGREVNAHFRRYSDQCALKTSLSSYIPVSFDALEDGMRRVVERIPFRNSTRDQHRRLSLLQAVYTCFHREEKPSSVSTLGTILVSTDNAAPPGSSAALAAAWRDAAATFDAPVPHPDSDIIPRLTKLYAADMEVYAAFLKHYKSWQSSSRHHHAALPGVTTAPTASDASVANPTPGAHHALASAAVLVPVAALPTPASLVQGLDSPSSTESECLHTRRIHCALESQDLGADISLLRHASHVHVFFYVCLLLVGFAVAIKSGPRLLRGWCISSLLSFYRRWGHCQSRSRGSQLHRPHGSC
jgi:hypothetical protein